MIVQHYAKYSCLLSCQNSNFVSNRRKQPLCIPEVSRGVICVKPILVHGPHAVPVHWPVKRMRNNMYKNNNDDNKTKNLENFPSGMKH